MMRLLAVAGLLLFGMAAIAAPDDPPDPKSKKDVVPDVDVAKTTERIVLDANEAGKRLGAKDPGGDTQRLQKDILNNIDALIRKAQEPPPMGNGSSPMSDMSKQPMGKGKDPNPSPTPSASRKERREKNKSLADRGGPKEPQPSPLSPDPKKSLSSTGPTPNKIEPKGGGGMARVPDVYKDIWGHLPEKMRQEMDLYFREQFMPRYSDLLRQYYSSLAERGGRTMP